MVFLSDEFVGSGAKQKSKPRSFKTERVGRPKNRNQSFIHDVLELGHPIVKVRHQKNRERVRHPSIRQKVAATTTQAQYTLIRFSPARRPGLPARAKRKAE